MPDPTLGERVCLYTMVKPGTKSPWKRSASCGRRRRSQVQDPRAPGVVDELAATKVGKINKKDLRADIALRLAGAGVNAG